VVNEKERIQNGQVVRRFRLTLAPFAFLPLSMANAFFYNEHELSKWTQSTSMAFAVSIRPMHPLDPLPQLQQQPPHDPNPFGSAFPPPAAPILELSTILRMALIGLRGIVKASLSLSLLKANLPTSVFSSARIHHSIAREMYLKAFGAKK
jgi:hypothetical protein